MTLLRRLLDWAGRITWHTTNAACRAEVARANVRVTTPRVTMTHGGVTNERPIVRVQCRDCGHAAEARRSDLEGLSQHGLVCGVCGGGCWHIGGLVSHHGSAA